MKEDKTVQANFRLPASLMRRLKAFADQNERTASAQLRFILDKELPPEAGAGNE